MSTFAEEIEKVAAGEPIEAARVGSGKRTEVLIGRHDVAATTPIISWEEAREQLDFEFEPDGPDLYAVYAWTPTKLIFTCQKNGTQWVDALPRNPDSKWDVA